MKSIYTFLMMILFANIMLAQPSNDDPCSATFLSSNTSAVYNNIDATTSSGEDILSIGALSSPLTNTVWFELEPATVGTMSISLCDANTDFDTEILVYRVGDCGDFSTYVLSDANDDDTGCGLGNFSVLNPHVLEPGGYYMVAVDGYNGGTGDFNIETMPWDEFWRHRTGEAQPILLDGTSITADNSNMEAATTEEAALSGAVTIENPMWFRFYGPASGEVTISTCSANTNFDTQMILFETPSPAAGGLVQLDQWSFIEANDDDSSCSDNDLASTITATGLTPNASYEIMVDGFLGATGTFEITATANGSVANDLPCNATSIATDGSKVVWNNMGASADGGEASIPSNIGIETSVWYKFTAPTTGEATISTCYPETIFDTNLEVFQASDCASFAAFTSLASNDDNCGPTNLKSKLVVADLNAGETYYVMIDGYLGRTGVFAVSVEFESIIGTTEVPSEQFFAIAPNPSQGEFQIEFFEDNLDDNAQITVFDLLGRQVHAQNLQIGRQSLDLKGTPAGVYLVRLKSGDRFAQQKVVIQ